MKLKQENLRILSNEKITAGHYVIEFDSKRIASQARPGQFVQILVDDSNDPLLPRPFSFLDTTARSFKVLYQVVGRGTYLISEKTKGETLRVLGPLGNGFQYPLSSRLADSNQVPRMILVGGGVGVPPLYHLARNSKKNGQKNKNIHVFIGARQESLLHCEKDFAKLGVKLHLATDDGSRGFKGFVTQILDEFLNSLRSSEKSLKETLRDLSVYVCGPTPMLKAASGIAQKFELNCQVSVEEPMPCGFGACLGCAIKIKDSQSRQKGFRYAMSCCEGPVFNSQEILWD